MAMTAPSTYGTATAPVPGSTATQDEWWNTGNTGLIGTVNNADSYGYNSSGADAASTTAHDANAVTYKANRSQAAGYTGQGYNAADSNAARYDNTNWDVSNPQTVQGQLANILDSGSQLNQRAETRALQGMNGRGLINSSMAVGAGQAALYDAALPIAQQDATTSAASARYNAEAANAAGQFNAANQQQTNLANQSAQNAAAQFGAAATNASNAANAANEQQTNLANQAAQNAAASQNSQQAQQTNLANAAAQNAANTTNAQLTQQTNLANAAADDQAAQFGAAASNTAALQNAQAANSLQQQSNQIRQAAAAGDLAAQMDVSKMDLDQKFKVSLANADAQTKTFLQRMQGEVQTQLANIEADYKTLMQTSASASDLYKGTLSALANLIADPNMDANAKSTSINGLMGRMGIAMNLIGSINGVDIPDELLDFGTVTEV